MPVLDPTAPPIRAFAAAACLALALAAPAQAVISFDLTADWSDTANPNGAWSYREGTNLLPHVGAWQGLAGDFSSAQPAWARFDVGTSNLPCMFKSSAIVGIVHDWIDGDVACHSTDNFNGIGSGTANITWTSPAAGVVTLTGAIWMGRDIGRGNHWSLSLDGAPLTSGDVASGDPWSRTSPMDFSVGSGGASALVAIPVNAGSVIKLDLAKTASPGDYSVIRMHADLVPTADVAPGESRAGFRLQSPSPNPAHGELTLRYAVPTAGPVTLEVFDVRGRRVATLDSGVRNAGEHVATWDARVAAGLYFVRLGSPGRALSARVVVGR